MTETEPINEQAVNSFVADAPVYSVDQLRDVIANLTYFLGKYERPDWHGQRVNDATIKATVEQLALVLQERKAACFFCAFGQMPKHTRCQHD